MQQDFLIEKTVEILRKSRDILFITGAGISADSGLPTYRGIGGLYNERTTDDGIPIESALAGEMLLTHPEVTWKYLAQIEKNCRLASYNKGHEIIAQIERHFRRVWVLTQNIDGFHSDAGSKNVIEIHGNFHDLKCMHCAWQSRVKDYSKLHIPPKCPDCGSYIRPEVVFFGEMLLEDKMEIYFDQLNKGFDLYVWVGTSCVFPYIQQPIWDAKKKNRSSLEINPGRSEISDMVDVYLPMKATIGLNKIWESYKEKSGGNSL